MLPGERTPEDLFKSLFRSLTRAGAVKGSTTIRQDTFIEAIQSKKEARSLIATLGDAGSNIRHKALLKGDGDALKALFTAMDTNEDGMLSWAEWSKYVGARRNVVVSKLFARMDTEEVGAVDAAAFVEAVKADAVLMKLFDLNGCSATTLIAMMDANGDGKVSKEELDQMVRKVASMTPLKKPSKKVL